ncbi:MAG: OadG family protein [Proteobacteria bacterium]|nr:OadG family protein [Pseudomonadota bacterium]MBU1611300.1 OadG family protein [Pseudomonadota bacterium]
MNMVSGLDTGVHNIINGSGIPIALTGMGVVFVALLLVSLFIALLPRALRFLEQRFPEALATTSEATVTLATTQGTDEVMIAAVVAAVAHSTSTGQRG